MIQGARNSHKGRTDPRGQATMAKDDRRSRALLESVETSGRSALDELRRLLDVLSDRDADAPRSPQPGVGEIPSLIDQVRQGGMAVELCIEGQPREVPGGVAIAAYRMPRRRSPTCSSTQTAPLPKLFCGGPTPRSSSRSPITDRPARSASRTSATAPPAAASSGCENERACTGARSTPIQDPTAATFVRARIPLESGLV